MGVREALAAMLTSDAESALLREDPGRLRHRYDLTEAELAMLAGAGTTGYRVSRVQLMRELRQALSTCLPGTVGELIGGHRVMWEEFLGRMVRRPQPAAQPPGMWEAERLVAWLAVHATPPLADFARYELTRAKLLHDPEAVTAARESATREKPQNGHWWTLGLLRLSPAAWVAVFDHDVTAGGPVEGLLAVRTQVLVQRRWDRPALRAYRISESTARLLARCDGTCDADGVIAALGGDRVQARGVIGMLAGAGVLLLDHP
ncbi:hypothetical protein HII36_14275 [Nonomuraea sp. NN258]|uniref:hypothetical protein n=1 Tax=Nonomuraea antri TaxID=2730852 RepID=UPI0015681B79|nr:hypothetical protein [Nonomuraea antri]NRQ32998.1 hypothetical protein [Nonomuraea antri]